MRKKLKKVIKGLKKASKTHAQQARSLQSIKKLRYGGDTMGGPNDKSKSTNEGHSRFEVGSGYYGETPKTKTSGNGGGNKKPPKVKTGDGGDVPFKAPLPYVGPVSALINLGAYGNYKGRQRYSKKKGLYRDYYKTQKEVLQPNSPTGKQYLKDAGYNKRPPEMPRDNDGPPPIILPVSQAASVNESLNTVESPYKKPTVVDGVFNYTVGLKKGGMLLKGKPKLTKKGWK